MNKKINHNLKKKKNFNILNGLSICYQIDFLL